MTNSVDGSQIAGSQFLYVKDDSGAITQSYDSADYSTAGSIFEKLTEGESNGKDVKSTDEELYSMDNYYNVKVNDFDNTEGKSYESLNAYDEFLQTMGYARETQTNGEDVCYVKEDAGETSFVRFIKSTDGSDIQALQTTKNSDGKIITTKLYNVEDDVSLTGDTKLNSYQEGFWSVNESKISTPNNDITDITGLDDAVERAWNNKDDSATHIHLTKEEQKDALRASHIDTSLLGDYVDTDDDNLWFKRTENGKTYYTKVIKSVSNKDSDDAIFMLAEVEMKSGRSSVKYRCLPDKDKN